MFKKVFLGLIALMVMSMAFTMQAEASIITIDGSSTVYPISEAVAEEFMKANPGMKVTVGISGTGGGFRRFCRGETDISNASRLIRKSEIDACKAGGVEFIELPVGYDGLAVITHAKNDWVKTITVAELKKIWEPAAQGKITKWNQVRPEWPDAPLRLYGAGTASGTFDYFTEAIVGKAKSSRGDFTASEDDNVLVLGIARDRNSLGFFGLAYYEENTDILRLIPIVNPKTGKAVLPTEKTVMDGSYYPLSRPLFIYVNAKAAERPEVRKFVEFHLRHAEKLVKDVRYVPLPARVYKLAEDRFRKGTTGTMFVGEAVVGVRIEDLLKK